MLVVTHEMGFARKAGDRVLFMADGQIVEDTDPDSSSPHPSPIAPRTSSARSSPTDRPRRLHRRPSKRRSGDVRAVSTRTIRIGGLDETVPLVRLGIGMIAIAVTATACGGDETRKSCSEIAENGNADRRHQVRPARARPAQPRRHLHRVRRRGRQVRRQPARRHGRRTSTFKEVTVRPARDADRERRGRLRRRDLLDHRHAQGEGRLRRPVLRRRPGPAGARGQHRHHRPESLNGGKTLLGDRLDLGPEGRRTTTPRTSSCRSSAPTRSASRRCGTARSTRSPPTTSSSPATRPSSPGTVQGRR